MQIWKLSVNTRPVCTGEGIEWQTTPAAMLMSRLNLISLPSVSRTATWHLSMVIIIKDHLLLIITIISGVNLRAVIKVWAQGAFDPVGRHAAGVLKKARKVPRQAANLTLAGGGPTLYPGNKEVVTKDSPANFSGEAFETFTAFIDRPAATESIKGRFHLVASRTQNCSAFYIPCRSDSLCCLLELKSDFTIGEPLACDAPEQEDCYRRMFPLW